MGRRCWKLGVVFWEWNEYFGCCWQFEYDALGVVFLQCQSTKLGFQLRAWCFYQQLGCYSAHYGYNHSLGKANEREQWISRVTYEGKRLWNFSLRQ